MTDEDKARARARAWLREYRHDTCDDNHRDDLPALAALLTAVRDEERERCAGVCDEEAKQWDDPELAATASAIRRNQGD